MPDTTIPGNKVHIPAVEVFVNSIGVISVRQDDAEMQTNDCILLDRKRAKALIKALRDVLKDYPEGD